MQFLKPQRESPRIYRELVAAALPRIREHASDAKVMVGETAPVGKPGTTIGPAEFMRRWLCLDENFDRALVDRTCAAFTRLDVDGFAHHPYGPTQRVPAKKDIVSLLVIRRLGRYLDRAAARGTNAAGPSHLQHGVRVAEQSARPHRQHHARAPGGADQREGGAVVPLPAPAQLFAST